MKRILAMTLVVLMIASLLPMSALAAAFDASVSGDYFTVISENKYALAPGATETELVLNNAAGDDRKVVHYFEVDTKNENIEVLPGYYGIDKLSAVLFDADIGHFVGIQRAFEICAIISAEDDYSGIIDTVICQRAGNVDSLAACVTALDVSEVFVMKFK